jgi:predicted alpha/beta-hydrolase family hydrolase
MKEGNLLIDGPGNATATVVLAHGAGAMMDSPFMNTIAQGLAKADIRIVRFEFPYMRARREGGRRGAPDREPVLLDAWREMVVRLGGGGRLVIGGKSMGGRIASMVADEVGACGLVCLGYPFRPPGRPVGMRTRHLETLRAPALIVQGTRDQFWQREEVAGYRLSARIRITWIEDVDHSLKPRARSGRTEAQNLAEAVAAVSEFMSGLQPIP